MQRQISIRLDRELMEGLRRVARQRAFAQNEDLNWLDVLEEAARRLLQKEGGVPSLPAEPDQAPRGDQL